MPSCSAEGCHNRYEGGYKLYKLPYGMKNAERRETWIKNIGRKDKLNERASVCEIHFTEDQFELKRADGRILLKWDAVPTLFSHKILKMETESQVNRELVWIKQEETMDESTEGDIDCTEYIKTEIDVEQHNILQDNSQMDEEKLIITVEEHPELYDNGNKNYYSQLMKDNIWKEIGVQMGLPADDCRKKWAYLRDALRRSLKGRMAKSVKQRAKFQKPWRFEEQMSFLKPYLMERPHQSSSQPEDDSASDCSNNATQNSSDPLVPLSAPPAAEDDVVPTSNLPPTPSGTRLKRKTQSPQSSAASVLQNYLQSQEERSVRRRDQLSCFFQAMEQTTRTLPMKLQAEVKAKIFKVVNDAELNHIMQQTYDSPS